MSGTNELYPIFLKAHQLNILIVGGGNVALEKLTFLLKSSPNAQVQLIAPNIREEIRGLTEKYTLELIEKIYDSDDIRGKDLVIATTDKEEVNLQVYQDCRAKNTLVNVADTPHYCDFYLGGIVTKGHVKVAISTNGKSPTTAKRLRQFFEEVIPDDINQLVENLNQYRKTIKGNFEKKVVTLNKLTESLVK